MGNSGESPEALMAQCVLITALVTPSVGLHKSRVHVIVVQNGKLVIVGSDDRSGLDNRHCCKAEDRHEDSGFSGQGSHT